MNYRHAFHAGNFADVLKHALLALALRHLAAKDKPFVVLDTHAGCGRYDLDGEEARRTGEWRNGIGRLLAEPAPPAAFAPYLAAVRALNPGDGGGNGGGNGEVRAYPGSPALSLALMRPQDRLVACELHPADAATLRATLKGDRRARVEERDGYGAVKALLPPAERRGLVLIDPPFERPDEFQAAARALGDGLRRWASGTFAVWYPIKDLVGPAAFLASVADLPALPEAVAAELYIQEPADARRLNGAGMLWVNPPYAVRQALDDLGPWLAARLAQGPGAGWRVKALGGTG